MVIFPEICSSLSNLATPPCPTCSLHFRASPEPAVVERPANVASPLSPIEITWDPLLVPYPRVLVFQRPRVLSLVQAMSTHGRVLFPPFPPSPQGSCSVDLASSATAGARTLHTKGSIFSPWPQLSACELDRAVPTVPLPSASLCSCCLGNDLGSIVQRQTMCHQAFHKQPAL